MPIVVPFPEQEGHPVSDLELEAMRRNTREFIWADPVTLILSRRQTEGDGAGGFREIAPQVLEPQTFRIIPVADIGTEVQTPDGRIHTPRFVLLGEWNADMERFDSFALGDKVCQLITPIRPEHSMSIYEKKSDVAVVG